MSPEAFLDYWRRTYGDGPLPAYLLRDRFAERWLRLHSLPGSKRYAETEDEHREILRRQGMLFADLIGEGSRCELVFSYYGEEASLPAEVRAALHRLAPGFLMMLTADESNLVAEYPLLHASFTWQPGSLDTILRAVADDLLETPIFVGVEQGRILAPYDGGIDLIVESKERRAELASRYASWRSTHPAGL
jgi:hypothetical protein